jgi:hypothetical protein
MVFTKRIQRWLDAEFDGLSLEKPAVMKAAAKLADAHLLSREPLAILVVEMRRVLSETV